jgi:hypothetical protein
MSETDSPDEALSVRARQQEDGDAVSRFVADLRGAWKFSWAQSDWAKRSPGAHFERAIDIARASLSSPPTTEETSHD